MVDVFFFKPETAYEMRISDWSSDVCSSDLVRIDDGVVGRYAEAGVAEHVLDVELPAVDLRLLLVHPHVDAEHRQRIARLAGDGAGRLPFLADARLDHPRPTGLVVEDVCAPAAPVAHRSPSAAVCDPLPDLGSHDRRGPSGPALALRGPATF